MSTLFLKACGRFSAMIGKLDRYTPEHMQWLWSGYVCQRCQTTLMNRWGVADVKCYAANGEPVTLMSARGKGKEFECSRCKYRWPFRCA